MKQRIKVFALTLALTFTFSAGTAWAAENTLREPVYVNGTLMNDSGYNSLSRLKTTEILADGALQVMDYVNNMVLVLPENSGYILEEKHSAWETMLQGEQGSFTVKRLVFAQTDGSEQYMAAEQTVDRQRPAALWQMQSWPEGEQYRVRTLYHDSADNSVLEVQMTFDTEPTDEMIDLILDNMRSLTAEEKQAYLTAHPVMDLKKIQAEDVATNRLVDYANGYTLTYPQDMTIDASQGDLCTIIANDRCQVEIYRQPLDSTLTSSTYKNYGVLFLDNTVDHRQQSRRQVSIDGMKAQVVSWMRPALARVNHDKPYYLSVDLVRDKSLAYTIVIKSDHQLTEGDPFLQALDSFTLIEPIGMVNKGSFINKNKITAETKPANYAKWNQETQKLYDQYFAPESKLTWGIFEANAPKDFYTLKQLEQQVDKTFKFLIHYQHIPTENALADVTTVLNNAYREKRVVELTLQTTDMGAQASNTVYRILNGDYDDFLMQYAKNIANFGHPVLFRLCNEMNGDWCQYSAYHTSKDAEMYRLMYDYVYDIFEAQGANKNVLWVWNPNERSFPDFSWNNARMYYPGNERVDIVGLTGYNTGNYYKGEIWRSFDEIYQPLYQEYVQTYDKPFMITEFASNSVGGNKSQWIREMFDCIHRMENIKVAIWWSGCDWESPGVPARIYYMNESPEILQTFKEMFQKEAAEQKASPAKTAQK